MLGYGWAARGRRRGIGVLEWGLELTKEGLSKGGEVVVGAEED